MNISFQLALFPLYRRCFPELRSKRKQYGYMQTTKAKSGIEDAETSDRKIVNIHNI
jgi:hypothetical protein